MLNSAKTPDKIEQLNYDYSKVTPETSLLSQVERVVNPAEVILPQQSPKPFIEVVKPDLSKGVEPKTSSNPDTKSTPPDNFDLARLFSGEPVKPEPGGSIISALRYSADALNKEAYNSFKDGNNHQEVGD